MPLSILQNLHIKSVLSALALSLATNAHAEYAVYIVAPKPLQEMLTQFLDLSRYKDRPDLSDDQFNFMIATVKEQVAKLVATEGFFSSETTIEVDEASDKRTVYLTVDAGPRTNISEVVLEVNGPARQQSPARIDEVIKQWPLIEGQPFRQQDWDDAKDKSLQLLRSHLYAAAEMTASEARILADQRQAELSVAFDSGPAFTLGPLQIKGAERYPASIVHNVSPLHEGEPYDVERLLALQRQIQRTPYYSNAIIAIARDPDQAEGSPVTVEVTEFPTQRIRAGVGYSTDTGANVQGSYSHNNVFGKAWVFDSQLRIEQRRQMANMNLAMPPDQTGFVNSADFVYQRTTLEGIDLRSLRYGLWRSRKTDKFDLAYRIQYYRDSLEQLDGAGLPSDILVRPGNNQALVTSVEWTWRNVDDLVFPRSGYLISNELGIAFKGVLTDETFVRAETRVRKFIPVGKRDLIVLGGNVGAVISQGGNTSIPASLLFRAGGNDSIRGYGYLSIGSDIDGTVYPSRYLLSGSAEYQHWFLPQWGAAVFYDVGTVTDNWPDKEIFHGVGVGARWRSPVGPVNVDLAYGMQRGEIRPHFSLGVAF